MPEVKSCDFRVDTFSFLRLILETEPVSRMSRYEKAEDNEQSKK